MVDLEQDEDTHASQSRTLSRSLGCLVEATLVLLSFLILIFCSIVDLKCCVTFRYNQSDFVTYFRLFCIIGYYKILNIVSCAIQ